jgi:methyl-accepting chemotaxis protein
MQQNAAAAEELSSTSEELSSQAMRLQDSVSYFTLAVEDNRNSFTRSTRQPATPVASTRSRKPAPVNDDDLDKDFVRYS